MRFIFNTIYKKKGGGNMQVLWNVIFDDKPKHTEQFYKLSDLVNKTSIYKKDKKMLKKNKKFLKQLSEEGEEFNKEITKESK